MKSDSLVVSFKSGGITYRSVIGALPPYGASLASNGNRLFYKLKDEHLSSPDVSAFYEAIRNSIQLFLRRVVSREHIGEALNHLSLQGLAVQLRSYSTSLFVLQLDAEFAKSVTSAFLDTLGEKPDSLGIKEIRRWKSFSEKVDSLSAAICNLADHWPQAIGAPSRIHMDNAELERLANSLSYLISTEGKYALTKARLSRGIMAVLKDMDMRVDIFMRVVNRDDSGAEYHDITWPYPLLFDQDAKEALAEQVAAELKRAFQAKLPN